MAKKKNQSDTNLQDTVDSIKEKFGEGAIMKLGEVRAVDVEAIPTSSLSLDIALGIGGIPKGRIMKFLDQRAQENQH